MAASVTYTVVDGEIIHETRGGADSFYVPDPLGNTAMLVHASGTATDTWTYWPYGEVAVHGGATPTPFGYGGTEGCYTDSSGSIYMRARVLEPEITRWMTVDPFWPLQSSYVYTDCRPVHTLDPLGLMSCKDWTCMWPYISKKPGNISPFAACVRCTHDYYGCAKKFSSTKWTSTQIDELNFILSKCKPCSNDSTDADPHECCTSLSGAFSGVIAFGDLKCGPCYEQCMKAMTATGVPTSGDGLTIDQIIAGVNGCEGSHMPGFLGILATGLSAI
jgi:RHS repeat-associated protein